jgi:hypothetical protein
LQSFIYKVKLDDVWLNKMNRTCLVLVCMIVLASTIFVNLQNTQATAENTWEPKHHLPISTCGSAVTVNDKIYLFSTDNLTGDSLLLIYNPASETWTQKTGMPTFRTGYGLIGVDNKIYTIGGQKPGQGPSNINEVYDTINDSWETKKSTIDLCSNIIANAVNGKIYAMYSGGQYDGETVRSTGSHIDIYYPETDTWVREATLPQELAYPQYSCVIDDKIFVLQDEFAQYEQIGKGNLFIYSTATNTWSGGASLPIFNKHSSMVATTGEYAPKQIYVIGGYFALENDFGNYQAARTTYTYDPANDTWSQVADMLTARYSLGVAVLNDKIYAMGGAVNTIFAGPDNTVNAIEVYTPLQYGALAKTNNDMNTTTIIAGVAIAGSVIAITGVTVHHFKHTPLKASKHS